MIGNVRSEEEAAMIAKIDTVMERAILALREMSNDTTARQMAQMREAHLHDEASALESAREEGYSQGRDEEKKKIIDKMRLSGMMEEQINAILSM